MPDFFGMGHHQDMDVYEIRRQKLRLLIGEHGRDAVARTINTNPDYLTQTCGPNPSRNVGRDIARRVEMAYNKPKGWMDTLMEDLGLVDKEDLELARAIRALPSAHRAAIQTLLDPAVKSGSDD